MSLLNGFKTIFILNVISITFDKFYLFFVNNECIFIKNIKRKVSETIKHFLHFSSYY